MIHPSNSLPFPVSVADAPDNAVTGSVQNDAPTGSGMRFADRFDAALQYKKADANR